MSANTVSARYIMGTTSEEYARLKRQAQAWEPTTGSVLERAGIAPGMHCLDVGCGPGEVMRLMAGYVGPAGTILGLDTDAAIGAEAISALRGAGFTQCRFRHADLFAIEHIEEAPFDLVFARLLLFHLKKPIEALRRLYRWVKPGDRLVIQDYDTTAVDTEPTHEVLAEFKTVWSGVCARPASMNASACGFHIYSWKQVSAVRMAPMWPACYCRWMLAAKW